LPADPRTAGEIGAAVAVDVAERLLNRPAIRVRFQAKDDDVARGDP
jgi:hypothetical protein